MSRRITEQELVTELDAGARRGGGTVFEVTGPPGSGRTAVLRRVARHVTGARVITARATAFESDVDGSVHALVTADLDAGPLVLVLDDAQWLDESSTRLFRALLRRIHRFPVTVVLATAGLGTAAEEMLAGLAEDGSVTTPPWYVVRLPEPVADEDLLARTLHLLREQDIRLLRALAVCGERTLAGELAEEEHLDQALLRLQGLGLVTGDRLTGGIGRAVLAGIGEEQRNDLRAEAVALGHRNALGFGRMSALLLDAPPAGAPWASSVLRREAAVLASAGRTADAARLLARALREPADEATRADLLVRLALCELDHAPDAADRRLAQVLRLTGPELSGARVRAADVLACRERFGASRRAIETALAQPDLAESEQEVLAALYWYAEGEPGELAVPSVPALRDAPEDPVCQGIAAWRLARTGNGAAVALARRALAARGRGPFAPRLAAADVLSWAAEYESALTGAEAVLVDARRCGARVAVAEAMLLRCAVRLRQGRVVGAAEDLADVEAELPRHSWPPLLAARHLVLEVVLLLAAGMVDEARLALTREMPAGGHGLTCAWRLFAHGVVALVTDSASAAGPFVECGRQLRDVDVVTHSVLPWRLLAAMGHRAAGEPAAAEALITDACEVVERWGVPQIVEDTRGFVDVVRATPEGEAARAFVEQFFPVHLNRQQPRG
ncbi:AAA family ATPase [Lentzea sp. CA-135723]|uniref:AAA family ATPase n=1 Tax=Lentzea sp. CA-135723 TaxID=3239950 RepID=UPI003D8C9D55